MRKPKKQKKPLNDLSRSATPFDPNRTLIGVIEIQKRRSTSSRRGRGMRRCRTIAVAGGKDCLRSAAPLVGQLQQAPTADSEALDLSPCCRTARRLMLFNAVNGNGPCGSQFCALLLSRFGQDAIWSHSLGPSWLLSRP